MGQPVPRTQVFVLMALMILLGLAIVAGVLPLGPARPLAGLAIASIKAFLIAGFFMHLRYRSGVVRVFALAGLLWLVILLLLTLADYLSRMTAG